MRQVIISEMEKIAKDHDKAIKPLTDDLVLSESGFDSLCFAILVARLDDVLGYDPFSMAEEAYFPVTLGDFIALYQQKAAA
jgi:hypothetical protein